MIFQRRSVRLRVALLVVVPLAFLLALFSYLVITSASTVLTLNRSRVMMAQLAQPITGLQRAMAAERAQAAVYYARPTPAALARLTSLERATDRAVAAFRATAGSAAVRQSASAHGAQAIAALLAGTAGVDKLRAAIPGRRVNAGTVMQAYDNTLAASYQVLEQAIMQEGNSAQVLPGIAVIELAISDEYLLQESALLNGAFTAGAFTASDHRAFVSLMGAHRLLYAQSLAYLTPADRRHLLADVGPVIPRRLTALEDTVAAGAAPASTAPAGTAPAGTAPNRTPAPSGPPPVRAAAWNATVSRYDAAVHRAVGQAEARLEAGARSQADAKLRTVWLTGGLGLAGVIISLVISLAIAADLTRKLSRLRDSALELSDKHLPEVVRRLREGQEVDAEAEVPPLPAGEDEIGQVNAAFNAASRTAVEAAVGEADLRRGINEVFRNLAKRNQSLLHRQMALLDALERKENDPDSLQGLFRIDHLTTRMRRHAESLVILAGDAPQRGWRNPVPFVDVLRAAAAEVEDYTRVRVICNSAASLSGPAVADVIHLIAELAENATLYSPQRTQVRIVGELVARGFAVEVEDRGLGLTDAELAVLNERLASPPEFDLSGSEQLGIFVAGRLAKRHNIAVTLTRSPFGGVTAVLLIPMDLVAAYDDQDLPSGVLQLAPGGRHVIGGREEPGTAGSAAPPSWNSLPAADSPVAADSVAADSLAPVGSRPAPGTALGEDARPAAEFRPAVGSPAATDMPRATHMPRATDMPSATDSRPATDFPAPQESMPPWPDAPRPADDPLAAPRSWATGAGPGGAGPGGAGPGGAGPDGAGPGGQAMPELPQRVRLASLAPQLRPEAVQSRPPEARPVFRDPEVARRVMAAFHRGWREGTSGPSPVLDPASAPDEEGVQGR